jgi:hypothetical protein
MSGCNNNTESTSVAEKQETIQKTEQVTTVSDTTEALTEAKEVTTEEKTTEEKSTEEVTTGTAMEASETITEQRALEAIKQYSYLKDPNLKDMENSDEYTIYWDVSTNENNEIVVLYRSYTAAEIRYYINPSSGETYVTEFVQGITDEERKTEETFNIRDYLN